MVGLAKKAETAGLDERRWFVFISHAGEDTWIASRIAQAVASRGATPFLDEAHVGVGEDFEERIRPALNRSNELLVYLTPWGLKRPYIWLEIGAAWGRGIRIVCILHGLSPRELQRENVPVVVKRRNLIDINEVDSYLTELRKRVTSYQLRCHEGKVSRPGSRRSRPGHGSQN